MPLRKRVAPVATGTPHIVGRAAAVALALVWSVAGCAGHVYTGMKLRLSASHVEAETDAQAIGVGVDFFFAPRDEPAEATPCD